MCCHRLGAIQWPSAVETLKQAAMPEPCRRRTRRPHAALGQLSALARGDATDSTYPTSPFRFTPGTETRSWGPPEPCSTNALGRLAQQRRVSAHLQWDKEAIRSPQARWEGWAAPSCSCTLCQARSSPARWAQRAQRSHKLPPPAGTGGRLARASAAAWCRLCRCAPSPHLPRLLQAASSSRKSAERNKLQLVFSLP